MKKYFLYVILAIVTLVLAACGSDKNSTSNNGSEEVVTNENYEENVTENPVATITMESGDQIIIELMPKIAPNTVANFISLFSASCFIILI